MKSAYAVLGVPGNASSEDIEIAFQNGIAHYSKEKLIEDPALHTKVDELKAAHKVLSHADLRRAHDRKIASYVAAPAIRIVEIPTEPPSAGTSILKLLSLVVVTIFAIGGYMSYRHEESRKAMQARELAQKHEEEQLAAQAAKEATEAEARRAAADAQAANNERRARLEASAIADRAQAQQNWAANQNRFDKNAAFVRESIEKQQAANAAAQRAAADQRALRNLCIINTGRPNC